MNTAFFIAVTRLEQGLKLLASYREGAVSLGKAQSVDEIQALNVSAVS